MFVEVIVAGAAGESKSAVRIGGVSSA